MVGIGLLAAGGLYSLFANRPSTVPSTSVNTVAPTAAPTVVRTDPSTDPSTAATVTGGQIGQAVAFDGTNGSGTVTVMDATWTNKGFVDPKSGQMYLVLDVRFEATSGSFPVGILYARVIDESGGSHLLAFGPETTKMLDSGVLQAGETSEGQLAYELPRGPATFQVLNERLRPVAEVKIPG